MNKLHYLISNRFLIYPKSTVAFFFVKSFFISLFLFPKLGDSYSARVDFVILFSGFVFLTFYRLKTFHFSRSPLRIYFILFFISVLSSFFGQIFTHDLIFEPRAFPYFMGQIRFIFVFYAVLILLSNSRYSDTEIYKLITILIILNSLITLFEFFNIFHMQTLINNIYHGDLFIERIESRAQGIFGRVHSAAYFTSVCFLFSLSMLIKYRSFFYFLSSAISFIAVIVTFSKGAILGLAFGVLFLLMKSSRNIVYILIFIISLFSAH